MKLISLKIETQFRSLSPGFEVEFHQQGNFEEMTNFNPFCLVGLNGCGKSNVLEALSQIFYHLELCVGKHLPAVLREKDIFDSRKCTVNAFTLEYLTLDNRKAEANEQHAVQITVTKQVNEAPKMSVVPLHGAAPAMHFNLGGSSAGITSMAKSFLPQYVVAYSSGENETLSIPFIKSRFIHLFEFQENVANDVIDYSSPENSLIYVDTNMSQAILLCCLLFEDKDTLESLSDYGYTGIQDVKTFRMHLREESFTENNSKVSYFQLFKRKFNGNGVYGKDLFEILKDISTISWYDESDKSYYFDFWVNKATKDAFKYYFHTAMECFQMFRLLYELNNYGVTLDKQREIFGSTGVYTDGKFGTPGSDDDVFHFLDFYLIKKMDEHGDKKELLLKEFSDGEHQFVHTMAICLLLKDSDSLILLDEPETHFNPSWRSRFVSILDRTLKNACSSLKLHDSRYVNFMKDVLITTHSPFIISDCRADNVIIVTKKNGHAKAEKASDLGIKTYGASTSFIQAKIFGSTDTIGGKAYQEMKEIGKQTDKNKMQKLNEVNSKFGESLEKLMVLSEINEE